VVELTGVLAAMLSSAMGGAAVGATRFLAGRIDPAALGALRFGIGFALLLPLVMLRARGSRWPARKDWPATVGLGLLFFGVFPVLFNASLAFTTAARGALALSTLPLLTMAVAAALGVERLTMRKSTGVFVAVGGVAVALLANLVNPALAPPQAWRGDLLMMSAALCMALYSIGSRPVIRRCGPLPFTAVAMASGAVSLALVAVAGGGFSVLGAFGIPQWLAVAYVGIFGGAVGFFLWAFALARTTPTLVAVSVTVNPVVAAWVGSALLGEPIHWNLIVGVSAVLIGIWIAVGGRGRAISPISAPSPQRHR
jgi:drug/metabolite transporter (DMT)-like permease